MSARCTGGCCHNIRLSVTRETLRRHKDIDRDEEAAFIWVTFRPCLETLGDERPGGQRHECTALAAGGCGFSYDDRPWLCRTFPMNMEHGCRDCGAMSDAEARGVALQRRRL